jgi:hypothetical protein
MSSELDDTGCDYARAAQAFASCDWRQSLGVGRRRIESPPTPSPPARRRRALLHVPPGRSTTVRTVLLLPPPCSLLVARRTPLDITSFPTSVQGPSLGPCRLVENAQRLHVHASARVQARARSSERVLA